MNLRAALRFSGRLLLMLAAAELLPIVPALWYGEARAAVAFLATALLTGMAGGGLVVWGRAGGELYRREAILIVVAGWFLASLFGALPYLLTGTLAHPVDALFESASGFTTTGASVLADVEAAGHGILFWRSFSQWLGGMGIIVLFVALLPEVGPGTRFIYKLEVPGPTAETLRPRVHDTAAVLWRIYLGMTIAETALLMLAGLGLYDALTHTFSTLSTGGFSPRNASVAAFGSPWVEVIVIAFMVAAGVNFSLYYALKRSRGRSLWGDVELRIFLGLIGAATAIVAWNLVARGAYDRVGRALLDALFQVASILTTTGFATADYDAWPNLSRLLLLSLMFIGGCAGSTAGGMKIVRLLIAWRAAVREVRLNFSPNAVLAVFVGGKAVPPGVVRSVMGFFILYFVSWGAGSLLLTVGGTELDTAMSASIAALANIGPGLVDVGPTGNFAFFEPWQKVLLVLLMWLGRLEVYSIAALLTASYWRR